MYMQENANAVNVFESVTANFGSENVKLLPDGVVKLKINYIRDSELGGIFNLLQSAHVEIRRSDKNILVLFTPKLPCSESTQKGRAPRVRDFYERLPEEPRIAAFDNTAKNKWDNPVRDLEEAILSSFYIGDSPQGANYWQEIILVDYEIKA